MQRVIILTEDEYDQLKSESPSSILQATANNLKKSNDLLTKQVSELQQELSTYKLVSATKEPSSLDRGYTYKDFVREYNFIAESENHKTKKPVLLQIAKNLQVTSLKVKEVLKEATVNGSIHRDARTNRYLYN